MLLPKRIDAFQVDRKVENISMRGADRTRILDLQANTKLLTMSSKSLNVSSVGDSDEEYSLYDNGRSGEANPFSTSLPNEDDDDVDVVEQGDDEDPQRTDDVEARRYVKKVVHMPTLSRLTAEMRVMMETSEAAVKCFADATRYIDSTVDVVAGPTHDLIADFERIARYTKNLNATFDRLDELISQLDLIDNDKLKIKQGPRTTIGDYVAKLEQIKGASSETIAKNH